VIEMRESRLRTAPDETQLVVGRWKEMEKIMYLHHSKTTTDDIQSTVLHTGSNGRRQHELCMYISFSFSSKQAGNLPQIPTIGFLNIWHNLD